MLILTHALLGGLGDYIAIVELDEEWPEVNERYHDWADELHEEDGKSEGKYDYLRHIAHRVISTQAGRRNVAIVSITTATQAYLTELKDSGRYTILHGELA